MESEGHRRHEAQSKEGNSKDTNGQRDAGSNKRHGVEVRQYDSQTESKTGTTLREHAETNKTKSDVEVDPQHKRHRVFLTKWQNGRPWLKTVTCERDVTSMYCDVCQRHPLKPAGPGKPNDTFIKGSTNFRLEAVIRHELSLVHQKAQELCEKEGYTEKHDSKNTRKDGGKKGEGLKHFTNKTVTNKRRQITEKNLQRKAVNIWEIVPLLRNAHAVVLHGRVMSDYVWLCELDEAKGLKLNGEYRTRKSAVTFIHYIAQAERERIKKAVQRSKFLSVIIDNNSTPEGTAGSGSLEEFIYLKTVSDGHAITHFIQRFHTEYPYDYQHVYKSVVKDMLEEYLLQRGADIWCKVVGFGLNQRSVSEGNGAVLDVFKDVFLQHAPWIQGVNCEVAQMEDSICSMLISTNLYRRVCTLLQDVYELYKNPLNRVALKVVSFAKSNVHKTFKLIQPPSTNQSTDFSELYDVYNETEEGSNHNAPVGWMLCMLSALENLMESYVDIVQHCQEESVEDVNESARVSRIYEALRDHNTVLYVQFMRDVLENLHRLFKSLRDTRTSLFNNYIVTKATVTKLKSYANSGGRYLSDIMQQLMNHGLYFGVELTGSDEEFHTEMRHVVTSLCETLDTGYNDVNMQVLSATVIADLSHWPQSLTDDIEFGDDCVKTLLKHFTPVLELAQVKLHRIEVEWNSIKMHLYNSSEPVHQRTWSDIHYTVGKKFANFLALIDLVLVLPSYSSLRELGRKVANQIKRDGRRRYDEKVKSDLMTTVLHSGSIEEFNPNRAIELWAQDTGVGLCNDVGEITTQQRTVATTTYNPDDSDYTDDEDDDGTADTNDDDNDDNNDQTETTEEFTCSLCEGVFSSQTELITHKRTMHMRRRTGGRKPCVCPLCNKTFKNKPSLSAHVSLQHRRKGEYVSPLNSGHHRKDRGTREGDKQTTCNMCGANFTSTRALRHHKLIHHKLSPYRCDQCAKCFNGKTALVEHRRCHSGEKPHECGVCGKRFRRSADVKEHVRTHDENRRRYPCTQCDKSFTQKIHLKYHLMTHTNDYRYYCDQCGKGFQMNCLLVRHKTRAHTHVKPYKCTMCDKSFKTKRDVKIHTDSHDPSKSYICNQCGKMFQSKHLVEGHVMRIHEKEKLPLECTTCSKRFRHPTMLLAHERVHTGETPFQCHTCGKTFKQKGHLTAHNRTHTGEKPYRCVLCNTRFTVSCSLKKHMKYVHEGIKRRKSNKAERKQTTVKPANTEMQQAIPIHHAHSSANMTVGDEMQQHRTLDSLSPNQQHGGNYSNIHHQMSAAPGQLQTRTGAGHSILHAEGGTAATQISLNGHSGQVVPRHLQPLHSGPHPVEPELVQGGPVGPMSAPAGPLAPGQMPAYWFMSGHYQEPSQ